MFASAFEFGAALLPFAISSVVDSCVPVFVVLPFCAFTFVERPFPRYCVGPRMRARPIFSPGLGLVNALALLFFALLA